MNRKIKELALQTGGSHYPNVNSELLEMFANMIINECINAVKETDFKEIIYTTFDRDMVHDIKIKCVDNIKQRFN